MSRILIVEDDPAILCGLKDNLEFESHQVLTAVDGEAGYRAVCEHAPDLVILDLMLPGIDGLTLLRELHARAPELPVVILSARSELATKLRGFELGAVDYLLKPFSLDELLARVRVQLRSARGGEDGRVLRAGELVLELARRQARIGDTVTDLTDREFRLLHFLVLHVGEVVSRERLLSEVWGYHFDPGSNVVDVCVRRLRLRLGPDAPIETVRNAGYRVAA